MAVERSFETPKSQDTAPFASKIATVGGNMLLTGLESLEKEKYTDFNKMAAGVGMLGIALIVSFVEMPINRVVRRGIARLRGNGQ